MPSACLFGPYNWKQIVLLTPGPDLVSFDQKLFEGGCPQFEEHYCYRRHL